jgi:hypothetical protein
MKCETYLQQTCITGGNDYRTWCSMCVRRAIKRERAIWTLTGFRMHWAWIVAWCHHKMVVQPFEGQ